MKGDTKASAPARASRTQTISYVDLMKPDEDWRNLPDASERRKIQNRLAQRAYRRREEAPALTQEDEDYSGSDSGSSTPSAKGDTEAPMDDLNQSTIATSEWLGRYFQEWPESADSERAGCMNISPSGDSLVHQSDAACYSDYQMNSDYPQQIVQPRPMLSKTPDLIPGHASLAQQQQQSLQTQRAMNESMFYPKAAYQMPWPSHNQRNVAFDSGMNNPMAPEQSRRMTLPSPPTRLEQLDLGAGPQNSPHQRKQSKSTVGRLLNTELRLSPEAGIIKETVPGYLPSPISDLSDQVWQRAKLLSPPPSILPSRTPSHLSQRQQQQQQQHTTPSAYGQQLVSPKMTPIVEATNPRTIRSSSSASASTTRRQSSPEKSPVLEKKQKQKKSEGGKNKSSSSSTPSNNNNKNDNTHAANHQATPAIMNAPAASPQPTSLLHLAVAGGHVDTLRLLLQRLDPEALNARDDRGYTALECAVMEGRTDLVAVLLEHGVGGGTLR
ncbi:hypothetical protein PG991_008817 [Apiospora marii]|uniref:BZIP domain-containing protein n=1 Tax=Apiospora marii TaxID=335849 RepID=A0ABR1RLU0_9PEZI